MRVLILPLLLLWLYAGCGTEQVVNAPAQFRKQTVVRAVLYADSAFAGVALSTTLPMGTGGNAPVTNAELYLRVDGERIVPLLHTAGGVYLPSARLIIRQQGRYELFGNAAGKTFYGSTLVPVKPIISAVYFRYSAYFETVCNFYPGTCYGALWQYTGTGEKLQATDFYQIAALPAGAQQTATGTVRTVELPAAYRTPLLAYTFRLRVFAYDAPFADWFATRYNDRTVENAYIQGGGSVSWNVYGEDAFGLFIGCAVSQEAQPAE